MLPVLVLGGAAIAGALGTKKSADAIGAFKEAKKVVERSERRHVAAVERFQTHYAATCDALGHYGRLRLSVYDEDLRALANAFSALGGGGMGELRAVNLKLAKALEELELASVDFSAIDAAKAGISAAGVGAGAYFAAIGAVGAFASASTGTAIAGLSGAAQSGAIMAWFGGGSLASGGLGAGVGAIALGGIVLGPALAAGGLVLNAQAQGQLERAKSYEAELHDHIDELRTARVLAEEVRRYADDLAHWLDTGRKVLAPQRDWLVALAASGKTWRDLDREEQDRVRAVIETARALKRLAETPVVDLDGQPHPDVSEAVRMAKRAFA